MKTTIGIISHNRGLYLDALLHSLAQEVMNDGHQVIVVDNASTEDRVFEVIERHRSTIAEAHLRDKSDWINDEYIAKNTIIGAARHDTILFLQDDMQFIGPRGHVSRLVNSLHACDDCQWITVNAVRRSTLNSTVDVSGVTRVMDRIRLVGRNDNHLHTTGLFKARLFEDVGSYPTSWPQDREFWGRSEDWYDAEAKRVYGSSLRGLAEHVPSFVPVWNDPRGGYAFNRDGRRWGRYVPPIDGCRLYYAQMTMSEYAAHYVAKTPRSFIDVARPIGWSLAIDDSGDVKKHPQASIMLEDA